jgi:hypothetical protein
LIVNWQARASALLILVGELTKIVGPEKAKDAMIETIKKEPSLGPILLEIVSDVLEAEGQ